MTTDGHYRAAHTLLLHVIDGDDVRMSPEQASALKAKIFDMKVAIGRGTEIEKRLRKQLVDLNDENNKLVGQVVSEERRAHGAEARTYALQYRAACELMRAFADDKAPSRRTYWGPRFRRLLEEWGEL